jgi:branched-chain amino acid transport system ATP-binding protein
VDRASAILEVRKLSKFFGGVAANTEVDMAVAPSEILGLIGPNGAGKTTFFNVISGFMPPTSGSVIFAGSDITSFPPHDVVRLGMARTFQASTLFMSISALENVFTGCHMSYGTSVWKRLFRAPSALKEERTLRHKAEEVLEFMGLGPSMQKTAANLPHGHQKILGVCMALATDPKLLLLDEPMTGMNAVEAETMIGLIRKIRDKGVTIIVVEHNIKAVMNLCDRIAVLSYGRKIAEGTPDSIRENKEVIEAYLGHSGSGADVA